MVSYVSLSLICNKEFGYLLSIEGIFYTNFLGVLSGGFFWYLCTVIALKPLYLNSESIAVQVHEFS